MGTLAPFTLDPKKAYPYPEVREKLLEIMQFPRTRLILITGRAIEDLTPLLKLDPLPEIWGSHGAERLTPNNEYTLQPFQTEVKKGLRLAQQKAQELAPFCYLEIKPVSLALHWRGMDEKTKKEVREAILMRGKPLPKIIYWKFIPLMKE